MNVKELIGILEKVKDKTLPINVFVDSDPLNNWVCDVEIYEKGSSDYYKLEGEVLLITSF
tara:strand:+ start:81 stop:260 length:180 start_codon:yes stop_codon:yes gene_type:complete